MKNVTLAGLKKKLDSIFSKFIRLLHADENGNVICYTCGKQLHWKEIQNGHWVSRQYLSTRWSEDNCRPQCVGCNVFGRGQHDIFATNLVKEGVDIQALSQGRWKVSKYNKQWYEKQIRLYTEKVKEIMKV